MPPSIYRGVFRVSLSPFPLYVYPFLGNPRASKINALFFYKAFVTDQIPSLISQGYYHKYTTPCDQPALIIHNAYIAHCHHQCASINIGGLFRVSLSPFPLYVYPFLGYPRGSKINALFFYKSFKKKLLAGNFPLSQASLAQVPNFPVGNYQGKFSAGNFPSGKFGTCARLGWDSGKFPASPNGIFYL